MSYVCPVCSTPQADGEHLANHLAFTAMLRGDGHEEWLDERVPDWAERDPAGLAPAVTDHVAETETELDAGDDGHDHGGRPPFEDRVAQGGGYGRDAGTQGSGGFPNDPEAQAILAEAEELTRKMRESDANEEDGGDDA